MTDHSGFDPTIFLGATLTEANTRRPPIPGGTVLRGTFGEPKSRAVEGKKDPSRTYTFVDIPVELDLTANPQVHSLIGLDKVTLSHSFSLDINHSGGGLDMSPGKNNGLRQLREALGMNTPGEPFNLMMVPGRQVLVTVKNEPYEGEVYDRVGAIAKI
jgi:hypothetical protein